MPIISRGNDHDYSNLSSSSSGSLDQIAPVCQPETPPVKGAYYRRSTRILRRSGLKPSPGQRQHVTINVGGNKYLVPWSTLDEFPLTRLGRLKGCNSYDEIVQICDDYDEDSNEFFFDRNPRAFRMIMTFVSAGKLRLLREMCVMSFRDELVYWGIEEASLESCCHRKLLHKAHQVAEMKRGDGEAELSKAKAKVLAESTKFGDCMNKLHDMVENPESGIPGKVFACLSILFVVVTVISVCVSTMPDIRLEEDKVSLILSGNRCRNMFIIETICVGWFSLEFILRFIQARSKWQFLRSPLNIIDILAILPYYVSLLVDKGPEGGRKPSGGNIYLEKLGLVLRVLRALRILYVMRLARHSLGLQTLGLTIRRCVREIGLLLLFLCVSVTLFAPLVYLAENEAGKGFSSIPASYWWAIISMTTVGYGDMVPRSIAGQVVALSSILSGILIMAFPATSIFHTFSLSYLELKQQQARVQAPRYTNLYFKKVCCLKLYSEYRDLSDTFNPFENRIEVNAHF
uniref:Potassium voltage-gated channel, subfamily G, member 4b n=1 Tax=Callorhinchus milii TaxID=7868 RepID=A0A4W3ILC0_CALMI